MSPHLQLAYECLRDEAPSLAYLLARRISALDPNDAESHHVSGLALLMEGRLADALPYLSRAVEIDGTPQRRYNLAMAYYSIDRHEEAMAELQAVLRLDPKHAATLRFYEALAARA